VREQGAVVVFRFLRGVFALCVMVTVFLVLPMAGLYYVLVALPKGGC
jgi:hypothetical protein